MKSKIHALKDCFLVIIMYLAIPITAIALQSAFTGADPYEISGKYGVYYSAVCTAVLFAWLGHRYTTGGGSFWTAASLRITLPANWHLLALTGISLNFFVSSVLTLMPTAITQEYQETISANNYSPLMIVMIVFVSPIIEEILYRGIVQTRLMKDFSPVFGIIITSFLFGIMHVQIVWIIYAALMGIILSAVAIWGRNTMDSIIVHTTFNMSAFLLTQFSPPESKILSILVTAASFVVTILLLKRLMPLIIHL